MKKEVENWIKQAEKDFIAAKNSFESKDYDASSFWCQQSVEKAFKALLLKKTNKIIKIHDLVILGKEIGIPNMLMEKAKELTQAYVYSRYPDIRQPKNIKEIVSGFLLYVEEILKWIKKQL